MCGLFGRLDLGTIYLHFPLNVGTFHLTEIENPYMEHLGYNLIQRPLKVFQSNSMWELLDMASRDNQATQCLSSVGRSS